MAAWNSAAFAQSTETTVTIWPATAAPVVVAEPDTAAVELGVKFRADVSGVVTGIRFYKASTNTGTHVANLWTSSGTRLATATFANETASGWQQVNFPTPIAITASTVYVASYHTSRGQYSDDQSYFAGKGVDSPPLHALADGASGANGVYAYGSTSAFPNQGWNSSNYWVDVVFSPTVGSDTTAPTVTAFSIPATASTLAVPITSFTATDNVAVTGYLASESPAAPSPTAAAWSATAPATYTFGSAGSKTLYAWAKDAAGNVSASRAASVTITVSADTTRPTVTAFDIPATATTLTVPITTFTATDNVGVTGYLTRESSSTPSPTTAGWSATAPTAYTFGSAGSKRLYAWAKDAAGNVSASRSDSVTITISSAGPEPTGWFAGDMHVHRSCNTTPESISSMASKMGTQKLQVISLLADGGNGEVLYQTEDLPRVTGVDDPVSTPGRIVHWDAEWHWDIDDPRYSHAIGGHVVGLGLLDAQKIFSEYTYPFFDFAHRQNGIAGFVHMQYLGNGIPQTLNCCIPLEYPVEVALGQADFISEDIDGNDFVISAYYRLLNTGFRPGLAAGTDYPCNGGAPLGSLLTYVQIPQGQVTYRDWVAGIAAGRTVISRNGHNEFLQLTVNGSKMPGDEIRLAAPGPVSVTVQWTANQRLTGPIELVQNGVVVAATQASAAAGAPATLTATVDFANSGWLAARRMGSNGHQLHTGAVFVIVNDAPIRASRTDAEFFVQWMDNLLAKTSRGGAWSSYFPTSRSAAQARYQAAKAIYQQIAQEAGSVPAAPTIFTSQTPNLYEIGVPYELGTKFWADVSGEITQVRLYTYPLEQGTHVVRLWHANDATLLAGPYEWDIASGAGGWQTFTLPVPVAIAANTDYVVTISNSNDGWYAEGVHGFDAPIVNGHLHTYVGSGVYTEELGTFPTITWENTNYFRDVVFVPY